jgi:autotransporter translocation and assembly factor TamB
MRRRATVMVAAVLVVLAILIATRGASALAWAATRVASLATGMSIATQSTSIGASRTVITGLRVRSGADPLLAARRIEIDYDLRDLLPGSRHRYGLRAIAVDGAQFTLVRHADGTYSIPLHGGSATGPQIAFPNHVPIAFTLRVRDSAVHLREPAALDPEARSFDLQGIAADATVDTSGLTRYRVSAAFAQPHREPIEARGRIDMAAGFAMHHITAAAIPLRQITDFFVNTKAFGIYNGEARNVDFRLYALGLRPDAPAQYHVGGGVDIKNVRVHVVGIVPAVQDLTGHIGMVDDQMFFQGLRGDVGGLSLDVTGAVYHFSDPEFRIGIASHGDLKALRTLFAFMGPQDIAGKATIGVEVEGRVDDPAILAAVDTGRAEYRQIPFDQLHARIGYAHSTVSFLPIEARAQGADMTIRGSLEIGDSTTHTRAEVHVDAPADALPYAGSFLGHEPLVFDALMDGVDTNFYGYGSLAARRGINRAAILVNNAPDGVLDVAPLEMKTAYGRVSGGYHLDRHTDRSAFWFDARNVDLRIPAHTSFLAGVLPQMPHIAGHVDRFAFVGGGRSGNHAMISGVADAHATTIEGVPFDRIHADIAGTLANAAITGARANGPWGSMTGNGTLSLSGAIAVKGHYQGDLNGLRPFFAGVPASGSASGTAAIALADGKITIQAEHMHLHDATIRGIHLSRASGTMVLHGGDVRVYNALAGIGTGDVIAAGDYAHGISLVAHHLDAANLRALGMPLDAGYVDADGIVRPGAPLPRFDGGVALNHGRVQHFTVGGSALVALGGNAATLAHVVGGLDGIATVANGSLGDLASGMPSYRMQANVPAGSVQRAVAAIPIALPNYYERGTFDARLRIAGAGLAPHVTGAIGIPAGSVNGLPFVDAKAQIVADPTGAIVRRGVATVGSTHLQFAAGANARISGVHVIANATDLSDFNNFFDTGDTLAGTGHVRFDLISQRHRLSSNGTIGIQNFRYRNLAIGNTTAQWASGHNHLAGAIDVDGTHGSLDAHGSIDFAAENGLFDSVRDSRYDLATRLTNVDLSTWIPAFGYPQIPVTGHVNGKATIDGRFPRITARGTASLDHGTVSRLPIDSAQLAFSSDGKRFTIDSASLRAPGLDGHASGSFGLTAGDPLALSLYAHSSDVPLLVSQFYRVPVQVKGDFESSVTVGGTFSKPRFQAAFDASNANLYGLDVPLAFGTASLRGRELVLQNFGVQLASGTMTVEGQLPISLQPFGLGPKGSPISFDVAVNHVDPSTFDALLGSNSKLGGTIDGTVGIAGTVGSPTIAGRFSIAKGSYASDLDRTPITNLNATVSFDRMQGTLDHFSAQLGSGTLTATGSATFATQAFAIAMHARNAQIDSPQFGAGAIDGDVTITHGSTGNALVAGNATLQNATLPFSAFVTATQGGSGPSLPPLPIAFDLNIAAGRNVRVRGSGYGAGLDIGASGSARLAGTLSSPTLDGSFRATNGTLTYFDRAFRVESAHVEFDPSSGVIPTIAATGTTRVANPDPNTALNPYGYADITVAVTGPLTALKIDFSSNPPGYSNEQILAMIAPFGGLINGLSYAPNINTAGLPGVPSTTPGISPIPGTQPMGGTTSTGLTVGQEAFNILNAQFTAGILSPFEGALSAGLGLQNVNLSLDYYGNVGLSATRLLGKTVSLIYNQTFGIPQRTSFGFQLLGQRSTTAQLTFYFETGPQLLYQIPLFSGGTASRVTIGEPLTGQSGFAFTLQRLFW